MSGRLRMVSALVAAALVSGCVPGGGGGSARPAGRRRASGVVRVRCQARSGGEASTLGQMVETMSIAALAAPESREVMLRAYVGDLQVAWLAAPTEELWALAAHAGAPTDAMRHLSTGFGPEPFSEGAPRPDLAAVRSALVTVAGGEFSVRRERSAVVVRLQLSGRPSAADEWGLWVDVLAHCAAASPGASAYRLELAAGRLVVAGLTVTGREADALGRGQLAAEALIDRIQICF